MPVPTQSQALPFSVHGFPTPPETKVAPNCHAQSLIEAEKPHPNKKKIFVFCDGTGNKFINGKDTKDGNSNVVKLYTTLRVADDQVAYYHPGVGTMGDPTIHNWALRLWSEVKGLAFGAGFQAGVLDAYRYLMGVYNDGDDIYLFGFSRGAYTARALAGMLYGYGLLCRGNEGHLLYAWDMFHDEVEELRESKMIEPAKRMEPPKQSINRNKAFAETYSRRVVIRFMGIWDTVSSVGWIYKPVRLVATAQNPIVQVGRHAISIDERRAYYRDNLWGEPVPIDHSEWPKELSSKGIQQDLAQVWFPGVHSDIGGGYPQHEAAPANVSLAWMIREVQQHGAELCEERVAMVLGTPSGVYDADHIYTMPATADHCLHDSLEKWWWILQVLPQQYYSKEDEMIEWRVPYGKPREIPNCSIIHGSAERRMREASEKRYQPLNLNYASLEPLPAGQFATTADLSGCFLYRKAASGTADSQKALRKLSLCAGAFTLVVLFGVLFLLVYVVAVAAVAVIACSLFLCVGVALVLLALGLLALPVYLLVWFGRRNVSLSKLFY